MPFEAYPKWLPIDGPGHPQNPGFVLVENEDQEKAVLAGEAPPAHLNPAPADAGKDPVNMTRPELIDAVAAEMTNSKITDDDLRTALASIREKNKPGELLTDSAGDNVPAPVDQEANKGGDLGEEGRTLPEAQPEPGSDAQPDDAKGKQPADAPAENITDVAETPADSPKGNKKA